MEQLPIEILTAAYDPTLLPSEPELFDWFWVDGAGRTWVQRVTGDPTLVQLDIFSRDGVLLDEVRIPATRWPTHPHARPVAWTADRVAVAVEGAEGVELITYRIVRHGEGEP
jgi:sugar lactone lactonase YvrE